MYATPFIPILFQTDQYARSLTAQLYPAWSNTELENTVRFRQRRRARILDSDSATPLEVHAVLHEITLKQLVGSKEVMRNQLIDLLRILEAQESVRKKQRRRGRRGGVTIRILKEDAPPRVAMCCPWVLFEYGDGLDGVCFLDTHQGILLHDDNQSVRRAAEDFEELRKVSIGEGESTDHIRKILAERYT